MIEAIRDASYFPNPRLRTGDLRASEPLRRAVTSKRAVGGRRLHNAAIQLRGMTGACEGLVMSRSPIAEASSAFREDVPPGGR